MRSKYKLWIGIAVLVIITSVGLAGLTYEKTAELFKAMTPFFLAFDAIFLLWFQKKFKRPFWIFAITAFVVGFGIELVGVHTGFPFGEYSYGPNLGFKFAGVPVIIGINWFILIYCTGIITAKLPVIKIMKAVLGAILMLLIDFVMEPVAMELDLWQWKGGDIPLKNYLAWFLVSFILLLVFHLSRFRKSNKLAPVLYIILLLFFTALNFLEIP